MKTYFVAIQARGTVALPADLRRRLHLDEPGAQVQIIEGEDGRIELRAVLPVAADQSWFWSEKWQAMEREADADIAAGRLTVHDGPEAMFDYLDSLPPEE
ncbi:MAG: AbrB/MazE/SpoVT family DNA-binding domain-containing protein [Candidatus Limnocylindrales bacterium]